jgi:hypothetical protein
MLWVLLVLALLLGAVGALGLAVRSLFVRGRRLAAELAATAEAVQRSIDAITDPADRRSVR